jgi:hypothetical protein
MTTTAERWATIKGHLLKHADDLAYGAGMNDGGAEALRQKIFDMGLSGVVPPEWERIVAPIMDPEYATYTRLKAKFEKR